ncbi:hypothetical protein PROFUN_10980 [Planoprotostelium fungivorum]|uniref:PPPDE domain-containing protein n=1 Tax=Planoprotostelium fungivorum TaxID=1890364 RepID=A0A2P6NBX9_9EUKA|nr:hypothetical protein PROFUN_10980 [Planoprotostelium fungivorum]
MVRVNFFIQCSHPSCGLREAKSISSLNNGNWGYLVNTSCSHFGFVGLQTEEWEVQYPERLFGCVSQGTFQLITTGYYWGWPNGDKNEERLKCGGCDQAILFRHGEPGHWMTSTIWPPGWAYTIINTEKRHTSSGVKCVGFDLSTEGSSSVYKLHLYECDLFSDKQKQDLYHLMAKRTGKRAKHQWIIAETYRHYFVVCWDIIPGKEGNFLMQMYPTKEAAIDGGKRTDGNTNLVVARPVKLRKLITGPEHSSKPDNSELSKRADSSTTLDKIYQHMREFDPVYEVSQHNCQTFAQEIYLKF